MQKIWKIGCFFGSRLHWQFEVQPLHLQHALKSEHFDRTSFEVVEACA
jgi:hypothetical protein